MLLLCMAVAFTDLIVYENPSMVTEEKIVAYFEYLLISLQMPMFTTYLLHTCAEDWRKSSLMRGVLVLWVIYFILLCVAQGTTFLYYVTPENQFVRGQWHPLLMVPVTFIMLINLRGVIRRQKNLPPEYYAAFLIYLLPLTITCPYVFFRAGDCLPRHYCLHAVHVRNYCARPD